MKKLIIIIWTALLLIKQGTIQGMHAEVDMKEILIKIGEVNIIVKQSDIAKEENVDAIVNPANFKLEHSAGVAEALAVADPEWNSHCIENKEDLVSKSKFQGNATRALITPTFRLRNQGVKWIINAVGPSGIDSDWKKKLKTTYLHTLSLETNLGNEPIKSLIFPPISTGIFAFKSRKVVITPTKAAEIAISTVRTFILSNNKSPLKKIYFTSRKKDGPVHLIAYKKALQLPFTKSENSNLEKVEKDYITKLERERKKQVQSSQSRKLKKQEEEGALKKQKEPKKEVKKWGIRLAVGTLAIIASLYLLKKYYPSA